MTKPRFNVFRAYGRFDCGRDRALLPRATGVAHRKTGWGRRAGGRYLKRAFTKRYLSLGSGQVHLLESGARDWRAPLYCLHATAYSGQTFRPLMERLAGKRRIVAPDTPGYGGSDRPAKRWTMAQYADAMAQVIEATDGGPADVLGYHTGAFIAAELAIRRPALVRRLILIGVPFYVGAARAERLAALAHRSKLTDDGKQFSSRWLYLVKDRPKGMSLERGFANFVDELRAYPQEWWAHDAAFTWPAETRLPLVTQPVLVINPDNHLSIPSRQAAALMQDCRVLEVPHLSHAIFEVASAEIAGHIESFVEMTMPSIELRA
jgi:pimeloyl-ACP methyl ester carboxylesterase